MTVYPEHNWKIWNFGKLPQRYWHNKENQRHFLEQLGKELDVHTLDDWYNVMSHHIKQKGGAGLLDLYGESLFRMFKAIYPEHPWKREYFRNRRSGMLSERLDFLTSTSEKIHIMHAHSMECIVNAPRFSSKQCTATLWQRIVWNWILVSLRDHIFEIWMRRKNQSMEVLFGICCVIIVLFQKDGHAPFPQVKVNLLSFDRWNDSFRIRYCPCRWR